MITPCSELFEKVIPPFQTVQNEPVFLYARFFKYLTYTLPCCTELYVTVVIFVSVGHWKKKWSYYRQVSYPLSYYCVWYDDSPWCICHMGLVYKRYKMWAVLHSIVCVCYRKSRTLYAGVMHARTRRHHSTTNLYSAHYHSTSRWPQETKHFPN